MNKRVLILVSALILGFSGSAQAGDLLGQFTDFGDVYIPDEVPASQTVKLKRQGGGSITIDGLSLLASDFSIDVDNCTGGTLGGPCDLEMSFSPASFFGHSAIINVTATGADNSVPPGEGTVAIEVTGNAQGCGDGIRQNAFETCDFVDPNSAGCCDTACATANDSAACNAGGCKTGGMCNGGFCDGGTDADPGTPCGLSNLCIEGATCNNQGECDGGTPVVCSPNECQTNDGCDPATGCVFGSLPAGTPCGTGQACDGSGNCGSPLTISKSADNTEVACSQNIVYTITVTNNGADAATNVVVTDTVPAGIDFVSVTTSQGACNNTLPPTCNIGTLESGESATIEVTVQAVSQVTVVNTATADSAQHEPVSADASVDIIGGDCPGGCSLSFGGASSTYAWGIFVILLGFGSWIRSRIHRR